MKILPPVIAELGAFLQNPEIEAEDRAAFDEWVGLEFVSFFEKKTLSQILEWAADNLLPRLAELKAAQAFRNASGLPSESDLENAYNWVETTHFHGSAKQNKWARAIAHNNHTAIALAWKQGKEVPTSATWWIENRNNIVINLP